MESIKEALEETRSNLANELKAPLERSSGGLATYLGSAEGFQGFEDFLIFSEEGFYRGLYICTNPEESKETFSYENRINFGRPLGIISQFYKEFDKKYKERPNFISIENPIQKPIDVEKSVSYFAKVFDQKIEKQKTYNEREKLLMYEKRDNYNFNVYAFSSPGD